MNRYAHEDDDFDAPKREKKHITEKRFNDRAKYLARRQTRENELHNARHVVFPEPEDDTYYRP
jgi:hypothetical protein